ncbi:hypothetical protein WSK_1883 [Novosphingobium sp. Rr 2-17]|uniref:hypothetical protein n=1 Tax=Novosphingobium sp. Rr 2-17 TaxID=555793 RepID=UPI0002697B5C|nr:hypothetical protein [Novosphingobium sp. Rr 2-17]EIZ79547.1 hypothetical protein WSK_1883 [Novosphingobium sp. Rr 2-17]
MASTSDDRIMTHYLVKYGAICMRPRDRPSELLETLYMTECYRSGKDLNEARQSYDTAVWNGVSSAELYDRLEDLSHFMAALARDRAATWGVRL